MKVAKLIMLTAVAVFLASCRSSKNAADMANGVIIKGTSEEMNIAAQRIVAMANENRAEDDVMTSKMNLTVSSGVKKISVGGSLKMKRDEVIQMQLMAFGFVEAGRIELTKDYLLIMDKIGHQYVKAHYKDIDFLKQAGVDFYTFQSLFWDELFVLGDKGVAPTEGSYTKKVQDDGILLVSEQSKLVSLSFLTNALSGLVRQTTVSGKAPQQAPKALALDWQYQSYSKLGKKDFPDKMQISLKSGDSSVQATIQLSNLKVNSEWAMQTEISKRYTEVPIQTIFARIMSLTH